MMEFSSVSSNVKCGSSDFSIDRILSEDTRRGSQEGPPSWLCCTRYRPPRLTRPATARVRRSGRHARVPFTAAQAAALEAAYARAPYLAPPALRALAAALQLRDDRIKIWFQNRRARERREKSTNITPPNAVTLAPTALSHTMLIPGSWPTSSSAFGRQYINDEDSVSSNESTSIHNDSHGVERRQDGDEDRPETPLDVESL